MRRKGFTLIELLVVIAIIAILAAILFPVFLRAKQAAQTSACLSNCKQIATGVSLYKDDNQGCWMACYNQQQSGTANYDSQYRWAFWMRLLQPYVKTKRVYVCPAAKNKFGNWVPSLTQSDFQKQWPGANYGINECLVQTIWAQLAGVSALNKESAIVYPTRTALIADCNSVIFWGGDNIGKQSTGTGADGNVYPDGMLRIKYPESYDSDYAHGKVRHNGYTMIVFADLHTKALSTSQIRCEGTNTNNVRMYPLIWPLAQPLN